MPPDAGEVMASAHLVDSNACAVTSRHSPGSVTETRTDLQRSSDVSGLGLGMVLGSAVEEAIANVLIKHPDKSIDKRLIWESIRNFAAAKLGPLNGPLELRPSQLSQPDLLPEAGLGCLGWDRDKEAPPQQMLASDASPALATPGFLSGCGLSMEGWENPSRAVMPMLGDLELLCGFESRGHDEGHEGGLSLLTETLERGFFDGQTLDANADGQPSTSFAPATVNSTAKDEASLGQGFDGNNEQAASIQRRPNVRVLSGRPGRPAVVSNSRSTPAVAKRGTTRKTPKIMPAIAQHVLLEQVAPAGPRPIARGPGRPSQRPSCARCKIRHYKCTGDSAICDKCRQARVYKYLCIPAEFKESRSVGRSLYGTRIQTLLGNVAELLPFDPSAPVTIHVFSGFNSWLEIAVRPYVPINQDALTHVIFRGLEGGLIAPRASSTAFSLMPGTLTPEKIDSYCDKLASELAWKEAQQSTERNRLANHILMFATNQVYQSNGESQIKGIELVRLALRFWAMQAVFFKCPWTIQHGGSRIDMSPLTIPGSWCGKTLLPRLVNQELDRAFESRMDELERQILDKLQDAVYSRHREHWCAVFLTSFILLHSLEKDSWNMHAWEYEKNRPGGTPWPLRKDPSEYYRQNKHISDVVMTHFRIVSQGRAPFTLDWTKSLNRDLLGDSRAAHQFVSSIREDLDSSESIYKQALLAESDFDRNDIESLNYLYTRKLVLD